MEFSSETHQIFLYFIYCSSLIVDFFTRFTREKTQQNNFSCKNFSVENNYCFQTRIMDFQKDLALEQEYQDSNHTLISFEIISF